MRPTFRLAPLLDRTPRPPRTVERGPALIEVAAPAHWTDAQIDAWLDWAADEGLGVAGPDPLAAACAAWSRRRGLTGVDAAEATAALLLGVASPARPPQTAGAEAPPLDDPAAPRWLAQEVARRRATSWASQRGAAGSSSGGASAPAVCGGRAGLATPSSSAAVASAASTPVRPRRRLQAAQAAASGSGPATPRPSSAAQSSQASIWASVQCAGAATSISAGPRSTVRGGRGVRSSRGARRKVGRMTRSRCGG